MTMSKLYVVDETFIADHERLRRKVDTMRGDGVRNSQDTIIISAAPQRRQAPGASAGLPTGEFQYMVYQMVAQDQGGWDFVRAHPPLL
jgi:hypothetical protein